VFFDEHDKPVRMIGLNWDLTERKQLEEAYQVLVNQSIQGLFIIQDYRMVFANRRFTQMSGYAVQELYSYDYEQLKTIVHPEDRDIVWNRYERRLQGFNEPDMYEFRGMRKNGESYWMRIFSNKINYRGKPAIQVAAIDVTESKILEERLLQVQKMDSIGQLAGGIAHDFNNILMAITLNAEFAMGEIDSGHPIQSNLTEVLDAAQRATSLTRQLLAFSRKQVLEIKVVNPNILTQNLDKMLRRLIGENISLLTKLDPLLGNVKADEGQLEQIIMNLVVNARDAVPEGGKITIETKNVDLDEHYSSKLVNFSPGSYVMIAVSDNGCGIKPEIMDRIFEPFFTTKEMGKGTGLGLSTVYGIVKQFGGDIHVYSELNQGTTFRIYLPRVDEHLDDPQMEAQNQNRKGTETVLVVEDDKTLRKFITQILQKNGYHLLEAQNGKDALNVCETAQDSIDLVITDIVMPEMNGTELAEKLMVIKPSTKVLFLSGYTDNAIVHNGILKEGLELLQKPVSSKDLLLKVRQVLDKHQVLDEHSGTKQ